MAKLSRSIYKCVVRVPSHLQSRVGFEEGPTVLADWKCTQRDVPLDFLRFQHSFFSPYPSSILDELLTASCVSIPYRPLEAVGGAPAAPEHREIPSRRAEPQVLHSTSEQPGPLPPESRVLRKVILHFWYLAPWNKHFSELRLCKVTTVWLRNTYLKRR